MIPETTIGITKIVRSAVFARILAVSPMARVRATALTRITVHSATPMVKP